MDSTIFKTLYPQLVQSKQLGFRMECGEAIAWHWPDKDLDRELSIALEDSEWSGGFTLDQLGDFAVKIPILKSKIAI